jgi:opacity protein-like surface antigen
MILRGATVGAVSGGDVASRRRRTTAVIVAAVGLLAATPAGAADLPFFKSPPPPDTYYRWNGFYIGANAGFIRDTSQFGFAGFPESFFAGTIPPVPVNGSASVGSFVGGAQVGYMYQLDALVLGVEQDVIFGPPQATVNATGVASGNQFGLAQSQTLDWLATLRGRIGYGPTDRIMIYGTGGVAFGNVATSSSLTVQVPAGGTFGGLPAPAGGTTLNFNGTRDDLRVGWAVGAGAEFAISPEVSARLEYLHFDLGRMTVVAPLDGGVGLSTHGGASLSGDLLRAGVNYRFGNDQMRGDGAVVSGFDTELGLRYWYSVGRTQKDLYDLGGVALVSRLTYRDLGTNSGEVFARWNSGSGVFLKGMLGLGAVSSGALQDEDFPPVVTPYSSTNSTQRDGNLFYLTGDLGYDIWRGPNYKVGGFLGFFHERETLNAYGCTQTAGNADICVPSISDPVLGITNDAHWNAARLGVNGQYIWNRFKFEVDAAWLPFTKLTNGDTHWLRTQPGGGGASFSGTIPEDGVGFAGYQFEGIISYLINPCFSVGIGGRYWHLETDGHSHFEDVTANGGPQAVHFVSDRYGGFLQGAVKF